MSDDGPRWWRFLNTPVGMFLLSSVLVAGISYAVAQRRAAARAGAAFTNARFDLAVLCAEGLQRLGIVDPNDRFRDPSAEILVDIDTLVELRINGSPEEVASWLGEIVATFKYVPSLQGRSTLSIVDVLNQMAELAPEDQQVQEFRWRVNYIYRSADFALSEVQALPDQFLETRGWVGVPEVGVWVGPTNAPIPQMRDSRVSDFSAELPARHTLSEAVDALLDMRNYAVMSTGMPP